MNEVSWLGFGIASTVTKSFMHFLPSAAGIGAPYPVDLKVTVGGSSLPRRTLSIDGARLGHPDGFRLEEAIPALNQQVSGMYLLQIELAPAQHRIDLSTSSIIIELQYQQGAVRYWPRRINSQLEIASRQANSRGLNTKLESGSSSVATLSSVMARGIFNPDAGNSVGLALRDPTLFASIVILNSSSRPIVARIFSSRRNETVGSVTVGPDSVKECELTDLGLSRASKLDSTWGSIEVEAFRIVFEQAALEESIVDPEASNIDSLNVHSAPVSNTEKLVSTEQILGAAAAAYVVYRDRNSRRISSVVAI